MINVVIDTNVYKENRNNTYFDILSSLGRNGFIQLYIPYIVHREIQTQDRDAISKNIDQVISSLSAFKKRKLSHDLISKLDEVLITIENEKYSLIDNSENEITKWAKSINAILYPLTIDQTNHAMEAYFQGKSPLISPKNRKDIPDSFIVQAINCLNDENGKINVISNDKKVIDSFTDSEEIKTFSKLTDFINSDEVNDVLPDSILRDSIYDIYYILSEYENSNHQISVQLESQIDDFVQGHYINEFKYDDFEIEMLIEESSNVNNIGFNFDESSYFDDGIISIPFNLELDVGVNYPVLKTEISANPIDNYSSLKDLNNHYLLVEKSFRAYVFGYVSIQFEKNKITIDDANPESLNSHEVIDAFDFNSTKIEIIDDLDLTEIPNN